MRLVQGDHFSLVSEWEPWDDIVVNPDKTLILTQYILFYKHVIFQHGFNGWCVSTQIWWVSSGCNCWVLKLFGNTLDTVDFSVLDKKDWITPSFDLSFRNINLTKLYWHNNLGEEWVCFYKNYVCYFWSRIFRSDRLISFDSMTLTLTLWSNRTHSSCVIFNKKSCIPKNYFVMQFLNENGHTHLLPKLFCLYCPSFVENLV